MDLLDQLSGFFLMLENRREIALYDLQKRSHRRRIDSIRLDPFAILPQNQRSHFQTPIFFLVELQ